jgi:hypothetical protein
MLIAAECDLAYFDRRAFLDLEDQLHRRRRNVLHFGADRRKLVPVLGQHLFQNIDRVRDARRIVLALFRQAHFLFLEAVHHVRLRHRVQAVVFDLPNRRFLTHVDVEYHALRRVFLLNANIFEVAGVPQRVEITLHGQRIVRLADLAEHPRLHCVLRDAARTDDVDANHCLLTLRCRCLRPGTL